VRVLVTGGRGLLGSAVVAELLARGHDVTTFQRSPAGTGADEILGDITDATAVAAAVSGCDGIVHLAAKVSMTGDWEQFEEVNVHGTALVLAAAQAAGAARFVHVSSPSVAHSGSPLVGAGAEPSTPEHARGHYARSKAMAEQLALEADSDGFAVTVVRPHLVWGPGDTQLVGRIIERARAGRLVLIDDGAALIDTTYVDNAADAIAQALERCDLPVVRGKAFVVTNGEPRTVSELLGRMALAGGADPPRRSVPLGVARPAGRLLEQVWTWGDLPDEPPLTSFVAEQLATAHWFDQRATRAALDWTPKVGLDEGFARLAAGLASRVPESL